MSAFSDIQTEVETRLRTVTALDDIPIVLEEKGDVDAKIDEALTRGALKEGNAAKPGVAILVSMLKGSKAAGRPQVLSLQCEITVSIFENVIINRAATGINIPGEDVLEEVILALDSYAPGRGGAKYELRDFYGYEDKGIVWHEAVFTRPVILGTD